MKRFIVDFLIRIIHRIGWRHASTMRFQDLVCTHNTFRLSFIGTDVSLQELVLIHVLATRAHGFAIMYELHPYYDAVEKMLDDVVAASIKHHEQPHQQEQYKRVYESTMRRIVGLTVCEIDNYPVKSFFL